jgi:hypothetical protein
MIQKRTSRLTTPTTIELIDCAFSFPAHLSRVQKLDQVFAMDEYRSTAIDCRQTRLHPAPDRIAMDMKQLSNF